MSNWSSIVIRSLFWCVVVNREPFQNTNLSIFRRSLFQYSPVAMAKRTRSQIQATEIAFLLMVDGHSLRDVNRWEPPTWRKGWSRGGSGIWFGCLLDISLFRDSGPKAWWRDHVSRLARDHFWIPPRRAGGSGQGEGRLSLLKLLPLQLVPGWVEESDGMDGSIEIWIKVYFFYTLCLF